MENNITISGTTMTIFLPEELDHYSSEEIRREADYLIKNKNISLLLLDFERTAFMDSSGVGMIIGRYKMMRYMGGRVAAIEVSEQVQKLLHLSGIYKVIDIYKKGEYRHAE